MLCQGRGGRGRFLLILIRPPGLTHGRSRGMASADFLSWPSRSGEEVERADGKEMFFSSSFFLQSRRQGARRDAILEPKSQDGGPQPMAVSRCLEPGGRITGSGHGGLARPMAATKSHHTYLARSVRAWVRLSPTDNVDSGCGVFLLPFPLLAESAPVGGVAEAMAFRCRDSELTADGVLFWGGGYRCVGACASEIVAGLPGRLTALGFSGCCGKSAVSLTESKPNNKSSRNRCAAGGRNIRWLQRGYGVLGWLLCRVHRIHLGGHSRHPMVGRKITVRRIYCSKAIANNPMA
ncbi:hypothetical protein BT67DRAFT_439396 [Trichocladium antarcticum]|uniref:Uncharacterized protein n=1 Tax=Trichocladium antarcticum TaxID=1450529 RepID=A0AAN6UPL1_9PEZI|nr:hypothetical protein BT67DRAFT_439396 [Trichocladium antarcticum]